MLPTCCQGRKAPISILGWRKPKDLGIAERELSKCEWKASRSCSLEIFAIINFLFSIMCLILDVVFLEAPEQCQGTILSTISSWGILAAPLWGIPGVRAVAQSNHDWFQFLNSWYHSIHISCIVMFHLKPVMFQFGNSLGCYECTSSYSPQLM